MDIKVKGLSYEILVKALKQARDGRLHILEKLTDTIAAPNADVKPHAPKMVTTTIPGDYIGALIGPGGKVIQEFQLSPEGSGGFGQVEFSNNSINSGTYVYSLVIDGKMIDSKEMVLIH